MQMLFNAFLEILIMNYTPSAPTPTVKKKQQELNPELFEI